MPRVLPVSAVVMGACALIWAQPQGTTPRPKAADYPAQARAGDRDIAAEFLVHTMPAEKTSFLVPDYLVVEVAIYPPKSQLIDISASQFRLRINRKTELAADTPEMVAMSLKYPNWEEHKGLEPVVQAGPVILGRRTPTERFPGDNRPPIGRAPKEPADKQPQTADEAAVALALPPGPCNRPVSGYVYFRFDGKAKSIRSLELIWQSTQGNATIRIR